MVALVNKGGKGHCFKWWENTPHEGKHLFLLSKKEGKKMEKERKQWQGQHVLVQSASWSDINLTDSVKNNPPLILIIPVSFQCLLIFHVIYILFLCD